MAIASTLPSERGKSSTFDKAGSLLTHSCSQQNQSCCRGASSSLKLLDLTEKSVFLFTDPKEN